ncbi:potassium channel subfamily K member 17 isoform X1 [Cricetulus griseus]|uniref:potassium channel subfamily K member 17 isoform X1 n=1 Tax=Cricetulus griseus TaxID=10029 RepID=UPI00022F43D0|nr:potassium channel subfamily K member 17 isoform X1 [Cricetulus griseus]
MTFLPIRAARPGFGLSTMCELLSPEGPCWARGFLFLATGLLLLSYLAYLVLGTGVFWALEADTAILIRRRTIAPFREAWFKHNAAQPRTKADIIQAYKDGTYLLDNTTSMGRWEFVGSFFFSVSTITTIGYGNLSPETMAARLFCILFALIGIPLNLVVLNRLGHLMQRGVHRCVQQLGGSWQDPARARWLAGSAALLSGLLLFLLLPPLLFSHMEGWSYVESFYFAFITLSTVGFGDYVIGMDPSRKYPLWYKNIVSLWILFGMAWLALIIKMILSLLEMPGDMCTCSLHCSKGDIQGRSWSQGQEGEHRVQSPGVTSGTFHSGYAI